MASLLSYGACQSACNAGVVTCYAAAGLTFGTVTGGVGAPAAALACNSVQATCMALCASKFLAEGSAEMAATGGVMGPVVLGGGAVMTAGAAAAAFMTAGSAAASSGTAAAGAGGAAAAAGTSAIAGTTASTMATGASAAAGATASTVATAGGMATSCMWLGTLVAVGALGYGAHKLWRVGGGSCGEGGDDKRGWAKQFFSGLNFAAGPKQRPEQEPEAQPSPSLMTASVVPSSAQALPCVDWGSPETGNAAGGVESAGVVPFPSDIRVVATNPLATGCLPLLHNREGTVISIENGLVGVDFGIEFGKHLMQQEDLIVVPNIDDEIAELH